MCHFQYSSCPMSVLSVDAISLGLILLSYHQNQPAAGIIFLTDDYDMDDYNHLFLRLIGCRPVQCQGDGASRPRRLWIRPHRPANHLLRNFAQVQERTRLNNRHLPDVIHGSTSICVWKTLVLFRQGFAISASLCRQMAFVLPCFRVIMNSRFRQK